MGNSMATSDESIISSRVVIKTVTVDIHIFDVYRPVCHRLSEDELEREGYQRLGLRPADRYLLAALYKADPAFVKNRPVGIHWQDDRGAWHYFVLGAPGSMHDDCHTKDGWSERCLFAGVPVDSLESSR